MINYFFQRLLMMLGVIFVVVTITFFIAHWLPGDPTALWVGSRPTEEQLEVARKTLGLEKSLAKQYIHYISNIFQGDLGTSLRTKQPITTELSSRFSATFELVSVSMLLSVLISFPFGLIAALKNNTRIDVFIRGLAYIGLAIPVFWLGMILQIIFFAWLGWFPLQGRFLTDIYTNNDLIINTGFILFDTFVSGEWSLFVNAVHYISLPVITMSVAVVGIVIRISKSSLVDTMKEPFFTTFLSFGFSPKEVVVSSAYKNTLIPVSTIVGLSYGMMLGGTFLIESIFDWPGLGQFGVLSILTGDFPAIVGLTLVYSISYVLINFLIDMLYLIIDPRTR
jgi:peptide/nickel transport system permease protein